MLSVETVVEANIAKVWEYWTSTHHIQQWNFASDEWHNPSAENDLKVGGSFCFRMEAKDGSFGFDFGGVYDEIIPNSKIAYTIGDGRKVNIIFKAQGATTSIVENFDPESHRPANVQMGGWQAILDNFKKYVESN